MCLGNRVDYISVFETSKLLLGLLVVDCFNVGEIRYQGEELGFWGSARAHEWRDEN